MYMCMYLSVAIHSPDRGSQRRQVLSIDPVAIRVLSKLNSAHDISALCPISVCIRLRNQWLS